jgi:hypothetical protein
VSRETLLDDAIAKAKEAEDWQLVEWLRMARGGESAARWYSDKLREAHRVERKLLKENAKLRELCTDMHAVISDRNSWWDCMCKDTRRFADRMRELGVEVDG